MDEFDRRYRKRWVFVGQPHALSTMGPRTESPPLFSLSCVLSPLRPPGGHVKEIPLFCDVPENLHNGNKAGWVSQGREEYVTVKLCKGGRRVGPPYLEINGSTLNHACIFMANRQKPPRMNDGVCRVRFFVTFGRSKPQGRCRWDSNSGTRWRTRTL